MRMSLVDVVFRLQDGTELFECKVSHIPQKGSVVKFKIEPTVKIEKDEESKQRLRDMKEVEYRVIKTPEHNFSGRWHEFSQDRKIVQKVFITLAEQE